MVVFVLFGQLRRSNLRRNSGRPLDLRLDDSHLLGHLLLNGGQRQRRVRLLVEGHEVRGQARVPEHRRSGLDGRKGFSLRLRMCENKIGFSTGLKPVSKPVSKPVHVHEEQPSSLSNQNNSINFHSEL